MATTTPPPTMTPEDIVRAVVARDPSLYPIADSLLSQLRARQFGEVCDDMRTGKWQRVINAL